MVVDNMAEKPKGLRQKAGPGCVERSKEGAEGEREALGLEETPSPGAFWRGAPWTLLPGPQCPLNHFIGSLVPSLPEEGKMP